MILSPDDLQKWKEIQKTLEGIYLKDLTDENISETVLKAVKLIPKELKVKKNIPTVIEYKGRRYILDHAHNHK